MCYATYLLVSTLLPCVDMSENEMQRFCIQAV